jgi:hypothetical protein
VLRLVPVSFDANTITFFFGVLRNHKECLERSVPAGASNVAQAISCKDEIRNSLIEFRVKPVTLKTVH